MINRRELLKLVGAGVLFPTTMLSTVTPEPYMGGVVANPVKIMYDLLCTVLPAEHIDHDSFKRGIAQCNEYVDPNKPVLDPLIEEFSYLAKKSNTVMWMDGGIVRVMSAEQAKEYFDEDGFHYDVCRRKEGALL